ncbi:hypothetical protein AXG89_30475 (plasmid) [Burkholderia sp. PAMC 26561]|nr:hypothetical protein AXG89_30475 [Burkholderia sp. PAMC 26561]
MTNTGYRALLAQREALEKQIEELRNAERVTRSNGSASKWPYTKSSPKTSSHAVAAARGSNRRLSLRNTVIPYQARPGAVAASPLAGSRARIATRTQSLTDSRHDTEPTMLSTQFVDSVVDNIT